jgi:hypothetical protein
MSYEQPDTSDPSVSRGEQSADESKQAGSKQGSATSKDAKPSGEAAGQPATVLVRGETIREQDPKSPSKDSASKDGSKEKDKDNAPRKEVSEAKVKMQKRLPALGDDADVGVQKEHIVTRDGKADLAFTGTLVASAAPASAPKGEWQEYRIYETNAGKHVFSKVTRNILAEEQDSYEAEVFEPSPSSMPSQLLRSARDLTRSHPLTWTDAAVAFFGYDPLAKVLYRKLSGEFEERIG